jgi:hypothetical protein
LYNGKECVGVHGKECTVGNEWGCRKGLISKERKGMTKKHRKIKCRPVLRSRSHMVISTEKMSEQEKRKVMTWWEKNRLVGEEWVRMGWNPIM